MEQPTERELALENDIEQGISSLHDARSMVMTLLALETRPSVIAKLMALQAFLDLVQVNLDGDETRAR